LDSGKDLDELKEFYEAGRAFEPYMPSESVEEVI